MVLRHSILVDMTETLPQGEHAKPLAAGVVLRRLQLPNRVVVSLSLRYRQPSSNLEGENAGVSGDLAFVERHVPLE